MNRKMLVVMNMKKVVNVIVNLFAKCDAILKIKLVV